MPSVPVTARWAPMTSLFIRLISDPVWVRVKNASGSRCTWSKSSTRRSKMMPSPMRDDHQRSKNDSAAVASAAATMIRASRVIWARSWLPAVRRSTICLNRRIGTSAISASSTMTSR